MSFVVDPDRLDLGGNIRHGDIHSWVPNLWKYLVGKFGVSSVLDVGCGEGHSVKFFRSLPVIAHGIDGLKQNVIRAVTPISYHDLLLGPYFMPVDLVWSCEVAEHIAPDKVDYYCDTLANGKVIAMTHATPEQGGHHHVNCQEWSYWVDKMAARGFVLYNDNQVIREIAKKEHTWNYFANTGLIFLRS